MCGGGSKAPPPPTPEAPPPPTPVRDAKIEATRERQMASRQSARSGYESTMLTGPGGVIENAPVASPILGG